MEAALQAGADAIGLVLARQSPRRVEPPVARQLARLARRLRPGVRVVGVFTDHDAQQLAAWAREAEVDVIQLHGGQRPSCRASCTAAGFDCIQAVWPDDPADPSAGDGADGEGPQGVVGEPGPAPWAYLLDRRTRDRPGGTGLTHPPQGAARWARALSRRAPVILAGGLGPDNVAAFLEAVRPWGVDASSGVERPGQPGVKDPGALRAFVQAVRRWEAHHGTQPSDTDGSPAGHRRVGGDA